jgi:hypothetical protein
MTIRGVHFKGGVNGFTTDTPHGSPELATFRFTDATYAYRSEEDDSFHFRITPQLAAYTLEWDMPMQVISNGKRIDARFTVRHRFADADDAGRQYDHFIVILEYSGRRYMLKTVDLEALTKLQDQLPEGECMLACFNCAHSGYSVCGNGPWGPMYCFRSLKREYREVNAEYHDDGYFDKSGYMDLCERDSVEMTDELNICPEFERRVPGRGYR